jgi:DNA-binding response OmpR family regulator
MRILLVEDEVQLAATIVEILQQEGYRVDRFKNGQEAWDDWQLYKVEYDLAILDWMLPGLSGIELCRLARRQGQKLPIIILTAKGEIADKVTGLDAGADDYLVKPFSQLELLARLRVFQRRIQGTVGELLLQMAPGLVLNPDRRSLVYTESSGREEEILLTNKEFQILEYLSKNANKIVNTERIRNYIWDFNSDSSSNVVAAHVRQIRKKLAGTKYMMLIETIPQTGYRINRYE